MRLFLLVVAIIYVAGACVFSALMFWFPCRAREECERAWMDRFGDGIWSQIKFHAVMMVPMLAWPLALFLE